MWRNIDYWIYIEYNFDVYFYLYGKIFFTLGVIFLFIKCPIHMFVDTFRSHNVNSINPLIIYHLSSSSIISRLIIYHLALSFLIFSQSFLKVRGTFHIRSLGRSFDYMTFNLRYCSYSGIYSKVNLNVFFFSQIKKWAKLDPELYGRVKWSSCYWKLNQLASKSSLTIIL